MPLTRRLMLTGSAALALVSPAWAQTSPDIAAFGLVPNAEIDQSEAMQRAIDTVTGRGQILFIPSGVYNVAGLKLPSESRISGVPGGTTLVLSGEGPILSITDARAVNVDGIVFEGGRATLPGDQSGLVEIRRSSDIAFTNLTIVNSSQNCLSVDDAELRLDGCEIAGAEASGLFAINSRGLIVTGNRIHGCNNGGIRIWRSEPGADGSIISNNRIADIGWTGGGNGQNGNGVNIFRADEVIVSNNHFTNCAFTAVRINAGRNTQVTGNTCIASGEVAIFSEFEFSGSVIANNIVDGAAGGISMTNLDVAGSLAVCSGNLVRNIYPRSAVNPDSAPYGIYAEAEAAVTGNVVENVPGIGIGAGHGPFLRNVLIADNVITKVKIGIAVTIAEQPGTVRVDGNMLSGITDDAIVGMLWDEIGSRDLVADAGKYPHVILGQNTVVK